MTRLNRVIKLALFLLLFSLLTIIALIAIILAQGNTLNDDGTISQTSIINISSVPQEVEVFLDNQKVTLNERKIEWIEPGFHNIKITKAGYKDWIKTVKVEPGIVKDIFAQLYPEKLNFTKLTTTNIDKVFFSDDSSFAYFVVLNNPSANQNGLWRLKLTRNFFDFGENAPILISNLTEELGILRTNPYDLTISPDNNKILLRVPDKNLLQIIEVNRQNQDSNLVQLLGYFPDQIRWFRNSESLIVEKNNLLIEYELSSAQKSLIDFSFENDLIYSSNSNYVLYQNTQDKKLYLYSNKSTTPLQSTIIKDDLSELENLHTIPGSDDVIVLEFENSLTYINLEKEFSEVISNVASFKKISNNGRIVIFDRGGKLFTYSLENTPNNLSFISDQNEIVIDQSLISGTYFTPSNRNIIFFIKEGEANTSLFSFDTDGENKTEILKDQRIITSNDFSIAQDSANMYLTLKEEVQNNIFNTNLFEIDLVIN